MGVSDLTLPQMDDDDDDDEKEERTTPGKCLIGGRRCLRDLLPTELSMSDESDDDDDDYDGCGAATGEEEKKGSTAVSKAYWNRFKMGKRMAWVDSRILTNLVNHSW